MASLTKFDLLLALVFTVVEIITLTVWLYLLNIQVAVSGSLALPAILFLAIGLYVEHVISRIQRQ